MPLYFVTSNEGKMREAQDILGIPLEIAKIELDEVQDLSIEQIVRKKAQAAFDIIQKPFFVDDAGVYITAWNGFPGPFVKYIHTAGGVDLLLRMLARETNRHMIFKGAIGFHTGSEVITFLGEVEGDITTLPRGANGWGWDPIFVPKGFDKTFSEMTHGEKNTLSHRYKALNKFKKYLNEKQINF